MGEPFVTYGVRASDREPLIRFMVEALEKQGCTIIHRPSPSIGPFRITFETPDGERLGVVAYAFLANNKVVKNRPDDEHRFQVKYGGDLSGLHEVWQDPHGLYLTLLLGINPDTGIFAAVDPMLHNPTRFSVSVEFKEEHVQQILRKRWYAWERERRGGVPHPTKKRTAPPIDDQPLFEVIVGGTQEQFLRLVRFEREAYGEAPGERHYLADHFIDRNLAARAVLVSSRAAVSTDRLHDLAREFDLSEKRVLDLIAERRMLKMAVRGSVAEVHLLDELSRVRGVKDLRRLHDDRGPDVGLNYNGRQITIECKTSSRVRTAAGLEKIDLQRTRAAKSDPCSRYYRRSEFDIVAACLHAVTEQWNFKYAIAADLDSHRICRGRLSNNVKLDQRWVSDAITALQRLTSD